MKNSIVCLAVALISLVNVAQASNPNSVTADKSIVVERYGNTSPLNIAIYKGDIETVKKLIKYGVNINEKSNGKTPLMYAARYNKVEIVKLLLTNGANPKLKDNRGFTALKQAEHSNAIDVVQFLKQI